MSKKLIRFNTKLKTNALAKKTMHVGVVNGQSMTAQYYVIENVSHMIRNSVMNGVLYTAENFDALANELMTSNARIPAPLSHPTDENGGFVSAADPITFPAHSIGAYDSEWRVNGDKLVSNTYIPVDSIDNPKESNQWLSDRINNKEPIDRSTGLFLNVEKENGIGRDGEPYAHKTTAIYELNHSAILNPDVEPGAKNNGEGVGIYTNSKGDEASIEDIDLMANASSPAMNLPLANTDAVWSESQAIKNIREYTDSVEKPSSNYRKFFLEFNADKVDDFDSYKYPFADLIDGVPHAFKAPLSANAESAISVNYMAKFSNSKSGVWDKIKLFFFGNKLTHDAIHEKIYKKLNEGLTGERQYWPHDVYDDHFIYRGDSDKLYSQQYELANDEVVFIGSPSEVERIVEYKQVFNNNTESIMDRKDIIALLVNKGITVADDISDADLTAALNKALGDKTAEPQANGLTIEDVTKAVNAAVKPLQEQLTANADKELTDAVAAVVALNKGIGEDAAKAMGLQACNDFLAANGHVPFNAGTQKPAQAVNNCASLELPEFGDE